MLEIEIKARLDHRQTMEHALLEKGFSHTGIRLETDIYYAGIDRSFKDTDEALRLRATVSGDIRRAALTYKGPKLDAISQMREEYEVEVADKGTMHSILTSLGFSPVLTVKKERAYFQRGAITACVDEVEGLGSYMELELLAPDGAERDSHVESLFALLEELGVPRGACTRKSYLEMLLEKMQTQ